MDGRALVIGGGVGGLATAVGLRAKGIEVAVFEQQDDVRKILVGGGMHLWTNAMRALKELGLAEQMAERGVPVERSEFVTWRGGALAHWDDAEHAREFGTEEIGINRRDVQEVLVQAQGDVAIHTGARCVGFDQDESGVTARFEGGREERGAVLIGADGLLSTIRAQLRGPEPPRYAGYAQFQAIIEGASRFLPAGVELIVFGCGARAVFHHVAGDRLFWTAAIYGPEGSFPPGRPKKEALLREFGGWAGPIAVAVEATAEAEIVLFDIYDRPPAGDWGRGRVTLLGDAAHPLTTNLGQGANQAFEDAFVLADCFGGATDAAAALRRYEQRRIPRTSALVKRSWTIARMGRFRNPLVCGAYHRMSAVGLRGPGLKAHRKFLREPL